MADILSKDTLFSEELVKDLFSKVKGKSSIVALSQQMPVAFNGNEIFTFSMDDEIALVGENEAKSAGSLTITPVKVVPVKVEYGSRVSDEFMYASEEKQIDILAQFNEGFAKKVARGLDIMAMHGVNPRTNTASSLISQYLGQCENSIVYDASAPDDNVEDAIALIGDYDVTGLAMSKTFAAAMGKLENSMGGKLYPDLQWGGQPGTVNGVPCSVNSTVSFGDSTIRAIVGDFESVFKWGYAKEIPMEIIPYGDPDNTGMDLKGYNQVYIRAEAYIGWGILDMSAFALVKASA